MIGPTKTLFLPDVMSATVEVARAATSSGMLVNGDIASMPLSKPPQVSVLFQVPSSTSSIRLM